MRLPLTFAALALALPMPILAQSADPQPAPSSSPEAKKEDADKKICKREVKTASRMGAPKICLTREQWAQRDAENRRQLRETEGDR